MQTDNTAAIVEMVDPISDGDPLEQRRAEASSAWQWFGFEDDPFRDSVNPRFFYRTESHEETYRQMRRCVENDICLGLTAAASGTGKTLLTQIILNDLDPKRYRPVLILVYPQMTRTALISEVARELEVAARRNATAQSLLGAVHHRIIELYRQGVKPVIIIDEVHFLKADTLHVLRTLSNIETPERKLVTILMFGEEAFLEKMEEPKFRALFSRVFVRADLQPLGAHEVEQYVKFRCLIAGGNGSIFERATFAMIHERSGGIPREINRLCYVAMERAAARRRKTIGLEVF